MHLDTQIGTYVHKIDIYMSKWQFGASRLGIKFLAFENWNVSLRCTLLSAGYGAPANTAGEHRD